MNINSLFKKSTPAEPTLPELKAAVERSEQALVSALVPECRRLWGRGSTATDSERKQFFASLEGLSPKVLGPVGYELARLGLSEGHSGFHGLYKTKIPMPFEFLSWAGGFEYGGIAFKINRQCFRSKTPRLFFTGDTRPYGGDSPGEICSLIGSYSHGICDISMSADKDDYCSRIEFSLSPDTPLWGAVKLQDGWVPASVIDSPVIQLPCIGEFFCCFGEVTDEGDVELHHDDFCMK